MMHLGAIRGLLFVVVLLAMAELTLTTLPPQPDSVVLLPNTEKSSPIILGVQRIQSSLLLVFFKTPS